MSEPGDYDEDWEQQKRESLEDEYKYPEYKDDEE
jgi:hypothetical protein